MDDLTLPFHHVQTPAFLVDRARVEANCDRMREKAVRSDVIFRPHVKTHKTIEIGRMQHGGAAGPITVSTMAEAEFFATAGFRDITYAVPIAPDKIERAARLARTVDQCNVLIDSATALDALEAFHRAHNVVFDAFLKIDCGYHRAGVDPDNPQSVELAERVAASSAICFRGVLTHAGHSYHARSVDEIRKVAEEEVDAVRRFTRRAGRDWLRSIGSTPTTSVVERFSDVDEVRPGNYVFYDAFQATIGSCRLEDCAMSVLATVVGSYPERQTLIIDAGALALSKDAGPDHVDPGFGYGIVCDAALNPLPMKLRALSQEHGTIATKTTVPVGTRLRIIPNHSCLTAAMYDRYHVFEGEEIVDEWKPVRGW